MLKLYAIICVQVNEQNAREQYEHKGGKTNAIKRNSESGAGEQSPERRTGGAEGEDGGKRGSETEELPVLQELRPALQERDAGRPRSICPGQ